MSEYLDVLRDWERNTANPVIYDNIDVLFPAYGFRRVQAGSDHDRWVSPLKINLERPKTPNREKTVVGRKDFKFREQGDWSAPIGVLDKLMGDNGFTSVYEAYRYVAEWFSLMMPTNTNVGSTRAGTRKAKVLSDMLDYFKWNLANNPTEMCRKTKEYLRTRGFSPVWINNLEFGFTPSWDKVEAFLEKHKGYSRAEIEDACRVRSDDGYTTIGSKHVLSIPYRCGGELRGFLFRAIDRDVQPKYKANSALERKGTFFNMPEDRAEKEIVIVEGEMDCLTATAAGILNVVAIGGSDISGERRTQLYDAMNRNTKKITLCLDLDADKDGNANYEKRFNAIRKSLHTIFDVQPSFKDVYVAVFPEPSDPDEYIRKRGDEAFKKILREAKPWWRYLADYLDGKQPLPHHSE